MFHPSCEISVEKSNCPVSSFSSKLVCNTSNSSANCCTNPSHCSCWLASQRSSGRGFLQWFIWLGSSSRHSNWCHCIYLKKKQWVCLIDLMQINKSLHKCSTQKTIFTHLDTGQNDLFLYRCHGFLLVILIITDHCSRKQWHPGPTNIVALLSRKIITNK